MNNFIMWNCSWELYDKPAVRTLIVKSKCNGIIIDASDESQRFYNEQPVTPKGETIFTKNSILLLNPYWQDMINRFPEIKTFYLDEANTNPEQQGNVEDWEKLNQGRIFLYKNKYRLIFGEPDVDKFPALTDNEEITLSRYNDYIKIFGRRIGIPFTNQISLCEKLEKRYKCARAFSHRNNIPHEKFCSLFNPCWISLNSNRNDYAELINWAKSHDKQIALYVDPNTSEKTFAERFTKFNEAINLREENEKTNTIDRSWSHIV